MLTYNAEQARELSIRNYEEEVESEIKLINQCIIEAIAKGETSISYSNIRAKTESELKGYGYKVERYTDTRCETTIKISW